MISAKSPESLSLVSCLFEDKFSCKLIISRNECDFYENECTGKRKFQVKVLH